MDANEIILIIEIKYENDLKKIETDEILSYDELKSKAFELFNIDKNTQKNFEFTFIDSDGEKKILGYENKDIIKAAKELSDGNFFIQLNLSTTDIDNNNIENIDNINENKKIDLDLKENDVRDNKENIKEEDEDDEEVLKLKDLKKIKNLFKNELDEFYKKIEENSKNNNIKIINELNNSMMNKIEQFSSINDKNKDIKINLNEAMNENEITSKCTKIVDYFLDNQKLTSLEPSYSDFIIIYKNEDDIENKRKHKNKNKVLDEIKELVNIIYEKENKFIEISQKIYKKIMDYNIDIKDLNNYFKEYLSNINNINIKQKKFVEILGKIYKYIEICKINQINLNFLEKYKNEEIEEDIIFDEEVENINKLDKLVNTSKFKEELLNNLITKLNTK